MLKDKTIRGFYNGEVEYDSFIEEVKRLDGEGYGTYIGTDSQQFKNKVAIVTCVCFYKNSCGSQIFYIKERVDKKLMPTLRSRILHEAYRSIEAAIDLDPIISGKLTVHLDIGSDPIKCKTAKFEKELRMLVKSQGFGCEIKPNSWASSSIADKYTKS